MKANLAVKIVRYVDDHQPGWVESQFVDAKGRSHTFIDKVPSFIATALGPDSAYPQPGKICCEILSESLDEFGGMLVHVSTARPYDMESTEGLSDFVVLPAQISD